MGVGSRRLVHSSGAGHSPEPLRSLPSPAAPRAPPPCKPARARRRPGRRGSCSTNRAGGVVGFAARVDETSPCSLGCCSWLLLSAAAALGCCCSPPAAPQAAHTHSQRVIPHNEQQVAQAVLRAGHVRRPLALQQQAVSGRTCMSSRAHSAPAHSRITTDGPWHPQVTRTHRQRLLFGGLHQQQRSLQVPALGQTGQPGAQVAPTVGCLQRRSHRVAHSPHLAARRRCRRCGCCCCGRLPFACCCRGRIPCCRCCVRRAGLPSRGRRRLRGRRQGGCIHAAGGGGAAFAERRQEVGNVLVGGHL